MAGGTDGNIISYDASGDPVAIATGNDGQVLTSAGAGQPPAFEAAAGFDVSSITGATALAVPPDADNDEIILNDNGTLKRLDFKHIYNRPSFHAYQSDALRGVADDTYTNMPVSTANELFDSDGTFNTTTKQFLPLVAGKYFCYGGTTSNTAWDYVATLTLNKNDSFAGVSSVRGRFAYSGANYQTIFVSGIFDLDGVDDFVECQIYQNSGSERSTSNQGMENFFGGYRLLT